MQARAGWHVVDLFTCLTDRTLVSLDLPNEKVISREAKRLA